MRLTLKDKALIVIEQLCYARGDDPDDEFGNLVYEIVHAANNRCLNEHKDWKQKVKDMYAGMVLSGEYREETKEQCLDRLRNLRRSMESATAAAARKYVEATIQDLKKAGL